MLGLGLGGAFTHENSKAKATARRKEGTIWSLDARETTDLASVHPASLPVRFWIRGGQPRGSPTKGATGSEKANSVLTSLPGTRSGSPGSQPEGSSQYVLVTAGLTFLSPQIRRQPPSLGLVLGA